MKARSSSAVLAVLALVTLGCEVTYRVGAMEGVLAGPSGSGASSGSSAGRGGSAGSGGAGGGSLGSECDAYTEPPPVLLAPFAEPAVIWERISSMVHGEVL